MGIRVGFNQYGKAGVRMVSVDRRTERHAFVDLTIGITLAGDLDAVHTTGDNAHVVPTDTMKNTAFAFARRDGVGEIEAFGLRLARHFVAGFEPIQRARVHISAAPWARIEVDGAPHPHAFTSAGTESRTATVVCEGDSEHVVSGVEDLVVLKTTGSEFSGFIEDAYTTLPETDDRILCTSVTARWRHASADADWGASHAAARAQLLERFAATHSLSLQQTLHRMAAGVLDGQPGIAEVRMSMPNRHHFAADLTPFGLDNPNVVFRVEDRPYGLIEACIVRDGAPDPGPVWDPYPLL